MPRKLHPVLAQRAALTSHFHGHLSKTHPGFKAMDFGARAKLIQTHVTKHVKSGAAMPRRSKP